MSLVTFPRQFLVDANGTPRVGAKANFYQAGTTTRITTYKTPAFAVEHANPVPSVSGGLFPAVYIDPDVNETFKLVITDSAEVTLYTEDDIPARELVRPYYEQTTAESGAVVTPSSYQYLPDVPVIDARRYGFSASATASSNVTALTAALAVAGVAGGIVQMPSGIFDFNTKITVPSNVHLIGTSMGFGANVSTTLRFTGTGTAIQVDGYYSRLADFALKNAGTGTIGVYANATQVMMERVTIMPDVSSGFSIAGYLSKNDGLVFTHILKRCYIYGNEIGVDFSEGNNFILDGCFIESNDTNVRVGWVSAVTNFVVCNGSVIEHFGDGRAAESLTSIGIDLVDVTSFAIRDSYFEVDGAGVGGASGQLGINLRNVRGGVIEGNYMYGGGQAATIISALTDARDVKIDGNSFVSVAGYGITEAVGARLQVGINSAPSPTTGVVNRTHTPVPTGLTVVNGSGGATHSISWERIGKRVFFTLTIDVTGTATTASTAGTTYFSIPNAMPAPTALDVCYAVSDDGTNNYGTGMVATNSRIYPPTWSAVNKDIAVSGSYRCA